MTKTYCSDEQKQEDAEAAAHFHIKAAKIVQVIIILRKIVLEHLICVISFLLVMHSSFIYSVTGFRAIDYPSRTLVSTRHFHILYKKCEHIYRQKLLLAQGGGGGGNEMLENFS